MRARRRGGMPTKTAGRTPTARGIPELGSRSATAAAGIAYTTPISACGHDQTTAGGRSGDCVESVTSTS
jgi:hypothetical protein